MWFFSHACETTVFGCILLAGMTWGFDGKVRTLSDKNIFEIPYVDVEGRPSGIACVSLKRRSLGYKNAPSDTRCFSEVGRVVKSAFLLRARHMEKSRAAAKFLKLESNVSWFSEHATHERENDENQGPLDIVSLATECALKTLSFDPDGLNSMRRSNASMKFTIPLGESNIVASVFSAGIPLTTMK